MILATRNVTKNSKKYMSVFQLLVLQNSHWKCHKKFHKNTIASFIQIYSKIATENVTKIKNNSEIIRCERSEHLLITEHPLVKIATGNVTKNSK